MIKETEFEIYFKDLSESKQQELFSLGYNNDNVISGVFPLTTLYLEDE